MTDRPRSNSGDPGREAEHSRVRALILISAALAVALEACTGTGLSRAPLVTPEILAAGRGAGFDGASIERGRAIFITDCGRCHALTPPASLATDAWERILPRMADKARLSKEQAADVRAYVLAASVGAPLQEPATQPSVEPSRGGGRFP